jgi:hypothetical protein
MVRTPWGGPSGPAWWATDDPPAQRCDGGNARLALPAAVGTTVRPAPALPRTHCTKSARTIPVCSAPSRPHVRFLGYRPTAGPGRAERIALAAHAAPA